MFLQMSRKLGNSMHTRARESGEERAGSGSGGRNGRPATFQRKSWSSWSSEICHHWPRAHCLEHKAAPRRAGATASCLVRAGRNTRDHLFQPHYIDVETEVQRERPACLGSTTVQKQSWTRRQIPDAKRRAPLPRPREPPSRAHSPHSGLGYPAAGLKNLTSHGEFWELQAGRFDLPQVSVPGAPPWVTCPGAPEW